MIIELIDEAVANGARFKAACELIGLSARTLERWRSGRTEDERNGPKTKPGNSLAQAEVQKVLDTLNSVRFRDHSPHQIVAALADEGKYVASESTMYRILRREGLQKHRERSSAPQERGRPSAHVATGPNQVWSWDITYLASAVKGRFYYLYMIMDVWSRKIVGFEVHDEESGELAAELAKKTCAAEGIRRDSLVLHSDNGGPMKGAMMLATLQRLGVAASFSRPSVSDDNPFSEALFRTMKYRPDYPSKRFADLAAAQSWVKQFVTWYNTKHRHSGIKFVTPAERHRGDDSALLARRAAVYEAARQKNPARWSGGVRNWTPVREVYLNPEPAVSHGLRQQPLTAQEPERSGCHPKGRREVRPEDPRSGLTAAERRLRGATTKPKKTKAA